MRNQLLVLAAACACLAGVLASDRINKFTTHKPASFAGGFSVQQAQFVDTSDWYGAEYTPTPAGNQLWWYQYDKFESTVQFELTNAVKNYGFTTLRVFLHNMVYDAAPKDLLTYLDRFLTFCGTLGIRPGFTFFDDCWNHSGATIPDSCVPVKGRHNGCWMACPQDKQRGDMSYFKPYVTDIVTRFRNDTRVRFWEVTNEPTTPYLLALRDEAFRWIQAINPVSPIISCWDDNNDTQAVDVHRYDTNFPGWFSDIFQNPKKGGLVTEGGSRWFQHNGGDAGSVKTAMVFYNALRTAYAMKDPQVPFLPGMMLSWEVMVGQSHTRWHWSTPDNSPEPTIPWDAHMHANGVPISFTESGLILNYTTGKNNFYYVDLFMPASYSNTEDYYDTLKANQLVVQTSMPIGDAVYEVSFWPTTNASIFEFGFRTLVTKGVVNSGTVISIDASKNLISILSVANSKPTVVGTFDITTIECGLQIAAWNLLRVTSVADKVDVYFNPMYVDIDASLSPFKPRVSASGLTTMTGGISTLGNVNDVWVDYISASNPAVMKQDTKFLGNSKVL